MEPRRDNQDADRKMMEEAQEPIAADPIEEDEIDDEADDEDEDEDEDEDADINQPVELEDERW